MLDYNRKFYSAFRGLSFPLRMILTRGDQCYFISSSGIANTLDLTDRILPRLQAREKCKPRLLNFPPYTKNQIATILQDRLNQVSANHCINYCFLGHLCWGNSIVLKYFALIALLWAIVRLFVYEFPPMAPFIGWLSVEIKIGVTTVTQELL